MLSSLLPGLRDLRTPLTVGFLWLTSLWVLFGSRIPSSTAEADGLAHELFRLTGAFGAPILLAASTFAAYIIGLMTSWLHIGGPRSTGERRTADHDEDDGGLWYGLTHPRRLSEATRTALYARARTIVARAIEHEISTEEFQSQLKRGARASSVISSWASSIPDPPAESWENYAAEARQQAVDQAIAEVALTAVRLHATFSQLWDEYDRAKAETEFRRGIAIPLAVLVGLIGFALSDRTVPFSFLGWLPFVVSVVAGCVLAVSLQYFSWQKEFESNENVLSSVVTAAIKSPIFESLEKMIEDKIASRDRAADLEQKAAIAKIQAEAGRVQVDTD